MDKNRLDEILLNLNSVEDIIKLDIDELLKLVPEFEVCINCEQNNPYHIYPVGEHILRSVCYVPKDITVKIAMFFHDFGKPACKSTDEKGIDHFYLHPRESYHIAKKVLNRLLYNEDFINTIIILVKYHDVRITSKKSVRRLVKKIGEDNFLRLEKIWIGDAMAQNPKFLYKRLNEVEHLDRIFKELF